MMRTQQFWGLRNEMTKGVVSHESWEISRHAHGTRIEE